MVNAHNRREFREMADRPPGVGCDTARYVQGGGRYECPQTLKAEILAYETRPGAAHIPPTGYIIRDMIHK